MNIKQVDVWPIYVDNVPVKWLMEEGKIYISKKYETAIHLCLCGCKEETVTPFGKDAWTLTESNGKITLWPSIGNYQFPCRSHYVITDNKANFV